MEKNTEKTGAICLLSGGLDSCVTLAIAHSECSFVIPLHVTYGQRTSAREKRAFDEICDHYGFKERLHIALPHIGQVGGSSLLSGGPDVPEAINAASPDGIPSTYVPFRNGTLLSVAAGLAEVRQARRIYIGAVEEDSSGYPDCRESFFQAFTNAIREGTRPGTEVTIVTPVIHLSKDKIVKEGRKLEAPLHLSWSCYRDEDIACGSCDSCVLRLRAFKNAGVKDPIPYKEG